MAENDFEWHYLKDGKSRHEKLGVRRSGGRRRSLFTPAFRKQYLPVMTSLMMVFLAWVVMSRGARIDYPAHLSDIVIRISCEDGYESALSFKDIAYYVLVAEREGNKKALIYDAKKPSAYWNLYMNDEGDSSGYMSDLARNAVRDAVIRDRIYDHEADRHGFSLSEEEEADIRFDAGRLYLSLTEREKNTLGLDEETITLCMLREARSAEYIKRTAGGAVGEILSMDTGGAKFEELMKAYKTEIDEDMFRKVRIGFITIN